MFLCCFSVLDNLNWVLQGKMGVFGSFCGKCVLGCFGVKLRFGGYLLCLACF